jgi:hypothetical protein
MKKQTALEWLIEQVNSDCLNSVFIRKELIDQANEMFEEQIIDSHIAGMEFIAVDPSKYKQDAEQYYNQTYGGDK